MNLLLTLAATALGVFVFIQAFALVVISARVVKIQFWSPVFASVEREMAGDELPVLDAARAVLEAHGFRYLCTRRVRREVAAPTTLWGYTDVYHHPQHDVHAHGCAGESPTPRRPYDIALLNTFTDGSALMTVNGSAHHMLTVPRCITLADVYAPNFGVQLAAHLARRAAFSAPRTDPAEDPGLASAMAHARLPELVSEGSAYQRGELQGQPVFSLRLLPAIKWAWRMKRGLGRRKKMDSKASESELPPVAAPDARHAAERLAFVRGLSTLNSLRAPRWFRWSAFAVSALGFVALGALWWGATSALLIGAVVVVHEAGHWLAMRAARFRDVQVFFVPGMGAATSGEKHEAHPLTHLAVYLAGPMPGLILALGTIGWMLFGHADAHAWWHATLVTATGAAFLINFLNLLPVMPLDGGRVVDLFVLARLPWFRFLFALASGGSLLWAGFETGDYILRGLGFLSMVALPHQYRMAKVSRHLLKQVVKGPLGAEDFSVAAARLFDFLSQPAYKKWTFEAKLGVGHYILPRFLGRLPNVKESLLGILIYLACCIGPLIVLIAFAAKEPKRFAALNPFSAVTDEPAAKPRAAVAAKQDPYKLWLASSEARFAAAPADPQRIEVLGQLIDEADEEDYFKDELRLSRMLYALTKTLPAPAREHADASLRLASILWVEDDGRSKPEAARLRQEAAANLRLRLARKADGKDVDLLIWALSSSANRADKEDMLAIRQEILDLRAAPWVRSGDKLPLARIALARALDENGQAAAAERQLIAAAADLQGLPSAKPYQRKALAFDHAWFLMTHQRPQEALTFVGPYLHPLKDDAGGDASGQRGARLLAALVARQRGDWQAVKTILLPVQTVPKARTGNRIFDFFTPARVDMPATLMLVEAERKLGNSGSAADYLTELRKLYAGTSKGGVLCRVAPEGDPWRKLPAQALAEIEQRELGCKAVPPR